MERTWAMLNEHPPLHCPKLPLRVIRGGIPKWFKLMFKMKLIQSCVWEILEMWCSRVLCANYQLLFSLKLIFATAPSVTLPFFSMIKLMHNCRNSPKLLCIRAPPRRGRYWEIHPRRPISRDPRDFPRAKPEGNIEGRGKSRGRRGWISQYLPSFGGVRTFSSSSIHLQGWIRKSIPVSREGLTVLKSILPCWGWENAKYPKDPKHFYLWGKQFC